MQPPKRHDGENPYTYLLSAAKVPDPVLDALRFAINNEIALITHRLVILDPCGHTISASAEVPHKCAECDAKVVSWIRDETIHMVLRSVKEVLDILKERRSQKNPDAIDISRVIKLGVQYEHAYILYCRHSVSRSKVKDIYPRTLPHRVAFKDAHAICFCNGISTFALSNYNLRRVSAIIARLHPFMPTPPVRNDPAILPKIDILKVEFQCLNILSAQTDKVIPLNETIRLCALMKDLPLNSFVWDQVACFVRNNLQPENQKSLLVLLKVIQESKSEVFKPLHLDICSIGRECLRTGHFVRALFISCLLHKTALSSRGLEMKAIDLLISCPYSAAYHLSGRFIQFMTEKEKGELTPYLLEKITIPGKMWAPRSVADTIEETYTPYMGEIDRAVVERLDCEDLHNRGRTNSCQNAWRFVAFLTYCSDPFYRQMGVNLATQALNKKTIPFNSQAVTQFIVERLEVLSKDFPELVELVAKLKRVPGNF